MKNEHPFHVRFRGGGSIPTPAIENLGYGGNTNSKTRSPPANSPKIEVTGL